MLEFIQNNFYIIGVAIGSLLVIISLVSIFITLRQSRYKKHFNSEVNNQITEKLERKSNGDFVIELDIGFCESEIVIE